jgi:hypothetical protein
MTIFELADALEQEAARIVSDAAAKSAEAINASTPADRIKTRRAVYSKANGTKAEIGLNFADKYPVAGTPTLARFRRQWTVIRPQTRQYVIDQLNKFLQD